MEEYTQGPGLLGLEESLKMGSNRLVLITYTIDLIRDLCYKYHILPGQMFTGKRKGEALVAARTSLARELRHTVGYLKGTYPRLYVVMAEGLDLDRYAPISYPVLGELLGMHHTSVLKMLQGQEESHDPVADSA